jgi:translation initiation factor IF-2
MRARGANLTDIVVLVVAADDGVMPQTKKPSTTPRPPRSPSSSPSTRSTRPGADPDRVKPANSSDLGLIPEEWGGETPSTFIDVSAKKGEGLTKLLELILLQAEVLELKANPNKPGPGT